MRDAGLGGAPPLPGSCSLTWSYLGVGARSSNSESMAGESRVGGGALGGSKTPQAGHPERQAFLSLGSGGGKSTFKVPVVQCPRRSLPDSQKATFRLSPHVAESELWSPCHGGLTLRTSPGPRHPRRPVCTHRRPGARASACAGVGRPRQCWRVCFASRESGASQVTGP